MNRKGQRYAIVEVAEQLEVASRMGPQNVLAGRGVEGAVVRHLPVLQIHTEFAQDGVHASGRLPGIGSLTAVHAGNVEKTVWVVDDDGAQGRNRPVECLPERPLFLLREVYAVSLESRIRQSDELRMLRGVW